MRPYPDTVENEMLKFYRTLSEKDRRRYAALEAMKLGHGGIKYIAGLFGCGQSTVSRGIRELEKMPAHPSDESRVRRPGGGRKSYMAHNEGIDEAFLSVVENNTAGDPMQVEVRWTNLSQQEIAKRLREQHGIEVSETVVKQLLEKHNFSRRKVQKKRR